MLHFLLCPLPRACRDMHFFDFSAEISLIFLFKKCYPLHLMYIFYQNTHVLFSCIFVVFFAEEFDLILNN